MEVQLTAQLHGAIQQRAEALGITLDEAIRQALSFYLSGVTDTNNKLGYSTEEVSRIVGLSTKTILRLVARGVLTPLPHSSRRYIFSRKEVERFAEGSAGDSPRGKKSPATRKRR